MRSNRLARTVLLAGLCLAAGLAAADFDGFSDYAYAMAVQPDGRMVLAGSTTDYRVRYVALARFLGDSGAPVTPTATRTPTATPLAELHFYLPAVPAR